MKTKKPLCRYCFWPALALASAMIGPAFAQQPEKPPTAAQQRQDNETTIKSKAPQIPDVEVLDQEGRKLRFYSDLVQGKTVAINFIFTTCTTICPPLTANFAKVQKNLTQQVEDRVRLISVSVDPENDTPERLKKYAELFHARPGWTFVTGRRSDLEQIWRAFNIFLASKQDHPPTVAVGNDVTHEWSYASGLTSAGKLAAVIEATRKKPETDADPSSAAGVKEPTRDSH